MRKFEGNSDFFLKGSGTDAELIEKRMEITRHEKKAVCEGNADGTDGFLYRIGIILAYTEHM